MFSTYIGKGSAYYIFNFSPLLAEWDRGAHSHLIAQVVDEEMRYMFQMHVFRVLQLYLIRGGCYR